MTFLDEPVQRTSRISYWFLLFADGGCAMTFWETSGNRATSAYWNSTRAVGPQIFIVINRKY